VVTLTAAETTVSTALSADVLIHRKKPPLVADASVASVVGRVREHYGLCAAASLHAPA
jgi:hypothetical protein